jgi:hypothetical protein
MTRRTRALSIALLAATTTWAQTPPQGQPPAPPPEAYAACKGKTEGSAVALTMPDGKTLAGTCRTINGTLVATPAGGPLQR